VGAYRLGGEGLVENGELGDVAVEEAIAGLIGAAAEDDAAVEVDGVAAVHAKKGLRVCQLRHEQAVHIDGKPLQVAHAD